MKYYHQAAELGNRQALFDLALCYQDGYVEQDLTKAFAYYQKIVDCGKDDFSDDWRDAAYHLARYYENGMGVEKDLAKALEWYRKAAEDGQEEAEKALKRLEGGTTNGEPARPQE